MRIIIITYFYYLNRKWRLFTYITIQQNVLILNNWLLRTKIDNWSASLHHRRVLVLYFYIGGRPFSILHVLLLFFLGSFALRTEIVEYFINTVGVIYTCRAIKSIIFKPLSPKEPNKYVIHIEIVCLSISIFSASTLYLFSLIGLAKDEKKKKTDFAP